MISTRALLLAAVSVGVLLGVRGDVLAADPADSGSAPAPAPASVLPIKSEQVLSHVGRSVDWYRGLQSLGQVQGTPQDLVARDRLQGQALTALRLAFDFGRASAAMLNAQSGAGEGDNESTSGFAGQLDQMTDRVGQRVTALQTQLAGLDEQIGHAKKAQKATLTAQRGDVAAALALAKEVEDTLQDMERFEDFALLSDSKGQNGVAAQLADLEKSVPEAARRNPLSAAAETSSTASAGVASTGGGTSPAGGGGTGGGGGTAPGGAALGGAAPASASSSSQPPAAGAFRVESAGVIGLITRWFSLYGSHRQLNEAIRQTNSLTDEVNALRGEIGAAVRDIVRSAFASSTSADAAQLNAHKAALEAGATQFKKLSAVLVPLGEQALTVESAGNTLREWSEQLGASSAEVRRYLLLRAGFLLACIGVVLAISEIWRRATFRYLHDSRRRRPFLALRRVVVGAALTMVIVFGLASELGSVATYIGFVTAGIAVALQNVILAVVAYFFFIGRYGVRVGDRITLAGVTGRVVEIGLVRIYLMELAGPELHSTGRIIVLSNAVLFQPTAMFKQIPGAEYIWHTLTLRLTASADVLEANKRLKEAADSVYAKYRPAIEQQYAVMQRTLDFETSTPQPEVRVQWSESGVECAVRYPVEPQNAAGVDQQMLKALRDALAREPPLPLASTEAVALKPSD